LLEVLQACEFSSTGTRVSGRTAPYRSDSRFSQIAL
jgi:hypothetical protein